MADIVPRTYLKETMALRHTIEGAFLDLGHRLHRIREEQLYKDEYQNFDEFLLEAKISKATASKLIIVYQTFVLEYNIPVKRLAGVGYSSLYTIARHATTKDKAEELVERATELTRDDLQESMRDDDTARPGCKHSDSRIVEVCNDCGNRKRRYDLENK